MPPVTPSPHRFVTGKQRNASPTKNAQPASALRRQVVRDEDPQTATQQATTSSQFAATPRFAFGRPKARPGPDRSPSPTKPVLVDALRVTARQREVIEDVPADADGEDEEMLDDEQAQALPTTEDHAHESADWTNDLPYSPKRRRLDQVSSDGHELATSSSPARPTFRTPHTPASHLQKVAPRFAAPQSTLNAALDEAASQHRPPFLRSSVAAQEPSEPLPEAFSPHRRGQKFVPGGMAATVQQWVIEAGQAAVQSRRSQAYMRGDDFISRVQIEEVKGEGPYVARAHTAEGEHVDMLLTRNANAAAQKVVEVGTIIGSRAPTWVIEIEGRSWAVGVDWKVSS